MKKRVFQKIFLLLCIVVLQFLIAYIGLACYYRNAFEYGTWINNIYCTGKSIEEVNAELSGQFAYDGITIYDKEQNEYHIMARDIDYQYDFEESLRNYLNRQNAWLWVDSFWKIRQEEISPVIRYDEDKLEACFAMLPFEEQADTEGRKIAIVKTKQGYQLINERYDVLSMEKTRQAIAEAISNSVESISLVEAGCYYDMELTNEMQEILHKWELIEDFQNCHIVYQMGEEQIPVDASVVCDWILLEEDGSPALDESGALQIREDAIPEFITALANEYDTVGAARMFQTTKRGVIRVEGGIYGNRIDREAEIAYLTDAFARKADEVHTPSYLQMAMWQGKDDVGNTYIEIDMEQQMMYYYLNGVLQIETPVVTGNTSRRMGTPEGVNYVYAKQTNRILRGQGYASHVNFWMPVKGNIGIHDAAWRSNYGGTIYQTNGSHGCINTPYDAMSQMYEMVEVGTPVVMYY
ncbi:MAG: L,D-transpeptidase/peptidoglycan binding protein [Bacillus sp. (in: Bacteria)]|nr:L,D-transpeptidase/peptidoglycan binding protein [Bacillus sp. (in: firmicutes)]MCM1426476.1 L,D-transpeptidase/peptidoglycan binding protein [Eubacterium sp.]